MIGLLFEDVYTALTLLVPTHISTRSEDWAEVLIDFVVWRPFT